MSLESALLGSEDYKIENDKKYGGVEPERNEFMLHSRDAGLFFIPSASANLVVAPDKQPKLDNFVVLRIYSRTIPSETGYWCCYKIS